MCSSIPPKKYFSLLSRHHQVFENLHLRQSSLVPQLFHPPCVALHSWLYPLPHSGIRDKPKASGALSISISHYHTVCDHSLLFKMAPQTLITVSKLKTPMKSFHGCLNSLGDSGLDMTTAGREPLMMLTWQCTPTESKFILNI